ncbi:MAG: sialate O-acetylesterase [bacterium]
MTGNLRTFLLKLIPPVFTLTAVEMEAYMDHVYGAMIDSGVSDWQIFQQNASGTADISVAGRWEGAGVPTATVELRLVREDNAVPVAMHLDWQPATTNKDGTWSATLQNVPSGGLYRLETHVRPNMYNAIEWSTRGDIRHFLGVGDLWIIAGQSNSAGYGRGPCYEPPELGLHLFNNAMKWALASQPLNETTGSMHLENCEGGNSGHGPWIHFARLVKQQVNHPIGLVQVSLGGSALASWNPTEPGNHPLYELMMRVHNAVGGRVRGILWYQGCSDAGTATMDTYGKRFIAAVKAWRDAMKQPELPVLTVQLSHWTGPAPAGEEQAVNKAWTVLRDAQRLVPEQLKNVSVIPTFDLPMTDGIHIAPFGNMLLAQRAAQSTLATVYGLKLHHLAPEPATARAMKEGTTIEIEFENVVGRMDCIDPLAIPFLVEDENGVVEIKRVEYTSSAMIRLQLGRPLSGPASVHGGYGYNPPPVPMDMDRAMPMLGFYGMPVSAGK